MRDFEPSRLELTMFDRIVLEPLILYRIDGIELSSTTVKIVFLFISVLLQKFNWLTESWFP